LVLRSRKGGINMAAGVIQQELGTPFAAEAQALQRNRAYAEALMKQGSEAIGPTQMLGNVAIRRSPFEGLGNIAQLWGGSQMAKAADEKQAALGEKYREAQANALRDYQTKRDGVPEVPGVQGPPVAPGEGEVGGLPEIAAPPPAPLQPAVAPDPRGALIGALQSGFTLPGEVAKMDFGADQADKTLRAKQHELAIQAQLTRDAKMAEIQAKLDEHRITAEEAATARVDAQRLHSETLKAVTAMNNATSRANNADNNARARDLASMLAASKPAPTPIVTTDEAGNVKLLDRSGTVIKELPKAGKPSANYIKAENQKKQLKLDLDRTISELEKATTDGGLLDKATGSGIGSLVDMGAAVFGKSTPGAIAAAQMKPIYDLSLKMVPRFEGPQSDKDTKTYMDASGQLGNPAVPAETKKAAGREMLRLMKERRGQFTTRDAETSVANGAPADNGVMRFDENGNQVR
jgi:hypothetical protein